MSARGGRPLLLSALAVVIVTVLLALLAALTLRDWAFQFEVPLATSILLLGVAVALALAVLAAHRELLARRLTVAAAAAREEAARHAHDQHRRVLGRVDHELKNPLTAIRTAVAGQSSLDASTAALIDAQAVRLSRVLWDLRKLGDLEDVPLHREAVDLQETVQDAVESVVEERRAAGHAVPSFAVEFPQAPWPLPPVSGDGDLLYTAVLNLATNAVKYTPADGRVEIRAREAAGWVTLEVADTGIGIPADQLDLVWEELSRADNARDRPGSGLGLALVRTIVRRHGGSCVLRSRLGQGTSVIVRLPIASTT